MPTDDQIWKMLDAWYRLIGRRAATTAAERDKDFSAMKRHIVAFEVEHLKANCHEVD